MHHLLSLGRRQHVPGCSTGWCSCRRRCECRKGYPSLAAPSVWPLSPSIPPYAMWFPTTCWELKRASSQTMCVVSWLVHSLAPFGDPRQTKQAGTTSVSCFSMQPPFADNMRGPQLCAELRNTCTLFFRHRLSREGLHLFLMLSYIVFLPSAVLVVCTFTPCGFSHTPLEPGEAAVRAAAGSCLCCFLYPPSSLSLFSFPVCQGTLF